MATIAHGQQQSIGRRHARRLTASLVAAAVAVAVASGITVSRDVTADDAAAAREATENYQSRAPGVRFDGGPEEGTRGIGR